ERERNNDQEGVIAEGQREQTNRISDNNQEVEIKETSVLSRRQRRKLKKKLAISQYYKTKPGRSTVSDEVIQELVKKLPNRPFRKNKNNYYDFEPLYIDYRAYNLV
ncbi:1153_t:CDS:2, partial [Cetraspora pellucida]